jgi:hypothetical protein
LTVARKRDNLLRKTGIFAIKFPANGSEKEAPQDDWKKEKALAADIEIRVEAAKDFSIFIRRNLLKSPDSEKLMKENESYFAFIFFHFLSFVSAARAEPQPRACGELAPKACSAAPGRAGGGRRRRCGC